MTTRPANSRHPAEEERLSAIQRGLASGSLQHARRMLNALQPAEIAHLLESLPRGEREILWRLVDPSHEGAVLLHTTEDVREPLLRAMDPAALLAATAELDTDDLADLVQELPKAITRNLLQSLDQQRRERLERVLAYPEDSAGGLMNTDTITVRPEVTLDVVMRYLRRFKDGLPEIMDNLIVVNRQGHYLGVLFLTELITNHPNASVAEVMTLDVQPIPARAQARDVATRFEHYDLVSAPVVDADGRLVGRITVDDVMDVIREDAEHQFMGHAGLSEAEDMFAPVLMSARRRALWLGVNLVTAFLASWVIGRFEGTIQKVVALAVLMPIVASMGGIAGTQTLTLAVRGLALGQLSLQNARSLIGKELAVSAINGLIWAAVVGAIAQLWFDNLDIALIIAAALTINLMVAAFSGAVLPLLLQKLGIDPALAGGVILTTVTDVVGFLAFLGLAAKFLV